MLRRNALTLVLLLFSNVLLRGDPAGLQLFLLVGQSNMAGRGPIEAADLVPHPRVLMLTKDLQWQPAIDPVHFDKPIAGVGLASTFARVVAAAEPDTTIGLIPAAVGGTSLDEWRVGGPLYTEAIRRAKIAQQRGKLAGILWHQGEADSSPDHAATYAARFATMIAAMRQELGAENVPLIVGETGRFRADGSAINAVLAQLPTTIPRCAFVSAEGLTDKGDKLHFDTHSLHEFGRRYAEAWFHLVASPGPANSTAGSTGTASPSAPVIPGK